MAGRDVVIVSSSGAEVVEPIGEMLGADRVIATRMVVEDGKYTGEIDYYAYAEEKAEAMRELAEERGYDLARLLRLQRLGHRRAHARGRRPPVRGQPRQGAAHGWPPSAAGRCFVHQAGGDAATAAAGARLSRCGEHEPRQQSGAGYGRSRRCRADRNGRRRFTTRRRLAELSNTEATGDSCAVLDGSGVVDEPLRYAVRGARLIRRERLLEAMTA